MFFAESRYKKLLGLISGQQEGLEKLQRDLKALQLDWENTYDKLRTMMQRIAKRAEAVQQSEEDSPLPEMGAPGNGGQIMHGALSPRQRQIQQDVLRRRAGMAG